MALPMPGTGRTPTSRSNPELQEWLENISQRMMKRIDTVGDEVQKLVDECGAVELDLKNTFNSFRCLSSTQFVENVRVYDEDETESTRAETPAKEPQHSFAPMESYEDEILPRYKDAVSTAWAAFQEINHQHNQASRRLRSRNKVLRNLDYDGRLHLVPHIIGTDEFARDIHCGLAELRHKHSIVDGFEIDSDTEREGADLAAELVGAGSVSEGEWSEPESDIGDQEGGFEPAVSAALDFKAMLEAALRNPSLPYDGSSSTEAMDKYGEVNNDYFLPNIAIDNYYSPPRTIPRTLESGDRHAGDTSANADGSDSGGSWPLTGSQIPGEVAVQSAADVVGGSSSVPSQPSRGGQPLRATLEELLKKPFMLKTQISTKEDAQNSSGSNVHLDYSGLGNIPFIPGGLFDEDEDDTVSLSSDLANVRDSNTEPTIPEGLFQRKASPGAAENINLEPRSSSSVGLGQSRSHPRVSTYTRGHSPEPDVNALFKLLESKGSVKLEISDPSASLGDIVNVSTRSETSNDLKAQISSKSTLRGGLFDDSDDEEDAGDLFGKSLSQKVTDVGTNSQPVLRTWTSVSSKGLFDDLEDEAGVQETLAAQPSGSSSDGRKGDKLSSMLHQVSSSGRDDGHLFRGQSSWTATSGISESSQKQTPSSSLSGNIFNRNQKQTPPSSPSGSTPSTTGKLSYSSSLSENSTIPLQKQYPSLNRTQQQFSHGPEKQSFESFVNSRQKQRSGSSLVGSVSDHQSIDPSVVKIDLKEDGTNEKAGEPHVNLESLLAAGIRPIFRTVVYSSDDSDSWSSSGSDGGGDTSSRGKPDSLKSLKRSGTSTGDLESNHEEDTTREIDGNKPAAYTTVEHNRSSSIGIPSKVLVPHEMRRSPSTSFGSQDVSPPSSPLRPGRSLSDTLVMEMPEEQKSVESLSSLLEPSRPRLLSVDQTGISGAGTSSNTDGADTLIHTTLSRPLGPSKRRAPSPSHTLKSAQSLPVGAPPRQSQPPLRNLSEDVRPSSVASASAIDIGLLATGRTFTSLFDEDDGEDDLFGTDVPEKQSDLQFGSRPQGPKSPPDIPTDLQIRERDRPRGLASPAKGRSPIDLLQTTDRDEAEERGSLPHNKSPLDLFTTRGQDEVKDVVSRAKSKSPSDFHVDVGSRGRNEGKEGPSRLITRSPVPSKVPTTSPAKTSDLKVDDGEPSSRTTTSRLSSLLFGDDDEDNEDALFGPLREKSSRGSSDWLVSTSSFSPARATATRRTSGSSLFDD